VIASHSVFVEAKKIIYKGYGIRGLLSYLSKIWRKMNMRIHLKK